ncbi:MULTISPECIES: hypothetical protein [unclassified Crossiella]|uniref:hypothetical protein n=1 Tax=unclassified Crossiella TaxID=2620835 RepID=UPI001FFF6ECD|nr:MULTISPECIES: hypothetical protein [unclassified Crossiella]MCK2240960.1 hypothetical protein [Crossiella sp. S99.2]MCK2253896.1 hypothetical protein [Crossiella sp. S99.1]
MSFRPETKWWVQCDGLQHHGSCTERLGWHNEDDFEIRIVLNEPGLTPLQLHWLNAAGWMVLPDGRHQCPNHVALAEQMVRAALASPPSADEPPH